MKINSNLQPLLHFFRSCNKPLHCRFRGLISNVRIRLVDRDNTVWWNMMYLSRQHLYPGHSWQQCLCSAASLAQMQKVFFLVVFSFKASTHIRAALTQLCWVGSSLDHRGLWWEVRDEFWWWRCLKQLTCSGAQLLCGSNRSLTLVQVLSASQMMAVSVW